VGEEVILSYFSRLQSVSGYSPERAGVEYEKRLSELIWILLRCVSVELPYSR